MMDQSFGELRSQLHGSLETRKKREALLVLLLEHYEQAPDMFMSRWHPYISGLRIEWPEPFATVTSLEQVEHAEMLIPGARFRLSLGHLNEADFKPETLSRDERLRHVCGLVFDGLTLTPLGLSTILKSHHLGPLIELDLGHTRIGTLRPVLDSAKTHALKVLDLQGNAGGDLLLSEFPTHFPALEVLDLGSCYIEKEYAKQQLDGLKNLKHLYMD